MVWFNLSHAAVPLQLLLIFFCSCIWVDLHWLLILFKSCCFPTFLLTYFIYPSYLILLINNQVKLSHKNFLIPLPWPKVILNHHSSSITLQRTFKSWNRNLVMIFFSMFNSNFLNGVSQSSCLLLPSLSLIFWYLLPDFGW